MPSPRTRRILLWTGLPVLALLVLVVVWSWAWFIPLVERQASAALGRPVTVGGLAVHPGRLTDIVLSDLRIANPEGFPEDPPLASIPRLSLRIDVMAFIRGRRLVIPEIALDEPRVALRQDAEGRNNYTFTNPSSAGAPAEGEAAEEGPAIGALTIRGGQVHAQLARLGADMTVQVDSGASAGQQAADQLRALAEGTYARQPIRGELLGGAVLSLRDPENPWPIRLSIENGPTRVSLQGTVRDPVRMAGANLRLELSGPDMAQLTPLTGVPIPATPPYRVSGQLDYAEGKVRFTGMEGRVGDSDLSGDIAVDPHPARPVVNATLRSRRVDLDDLAGFIGGTPGDRPAPAARGRRGKMLPDTPVNLPRLQAADIHLTYDGAQIRGRNMPLDDLHAKLDIVDGAIALHPLRFGVGSGRIEGDFDFAPLDNGGLHAKGEVKFQRVDLSRLMGVTPLGEGQGRIGGSASIDARGRSLAEMLAQGNGALTLGMAGGNLSALLVDISGLQLADAILSALGLPNRTPVQCFIADMRLQRGMLNTRTVLLDTESALISGFGDINLRDERLDYTLRTEPKHFTVGALSTDILIRGPFSGPSVLPEPVELGARAGAAVGLGLLFPPLAVLPTIRFGIGEDQRCEGLVRRAR